MPRKAVKNPMLEVAAAFKGFSHVRKVLHEVRAVQTRFVQLDHATRVGGYPIERFTLVHGPSNEGKTALGLGLIDSFLTGDHFALHIDAERTTPITWVEQLMAKMASHPYYFADRPDTYEAAILKVRTFLNTVANLRAQGKVPKEASAIVLCDSLRKLVPAGLMDEIIMTERDLAKDLTGKKVSAGRDRAGQIRAKMNAAWMDELVPLLEHANATFVAIGREMVDPDNTSDWAKKAGSNYKLGGGGAIYFDSSLVTRVERDKWVGQKEGEGDKERTVVFGERHKLTIKKTKIGGKDGKVTTCHFHSSNGALIPLGFDRARDVLDLARRFEVLGATRGGWMTYEDQKWQGEHQAVVKLTTGDPGVLKRLEAEVRAKFALHRPIEHDEETGEVE